MVIKYSKIPIPIMTFRYVNLPIDKKGNEEEFSYYAAYSDKFKPKFKRRATAWCKKNCEKRYVMKIHGAWFQTREDATAFKLRWL